MNIYRINPIGGSSGFKVHVADEAGGLRVVGVFPSETDAQAWIASDSGQTSSTGCDTGKALESASQT
jgi:hypothetical protein